VRGFNILHGGRYSLLTPSGLVARAVTGIVVYVILHVLGFRAYVTMLSGTSPTGEPCTYIDSVKMVAYLLSYLFAIAAAPILLIAAAVLALLQRKFISRDDH